MEETWTVYILKCSDGTHYVGCTKNIMDRVKRLNNGDVNYTSTRLSYQIIHQGIFYNKYKAYEFEK
jgi:putative endonuclease